MTEPTEAEKAKGLAGLYTFLGGRKQTNVIGGAVLLTAAAFYLNASFTEYAGFLTGFLLGGNAATAYEDRGREKK